jgi:hypothetical protein
MRAHVRLRKWVSQRRQTQHWRSESVRVRFTNTANQPGSLFCPCLCCPSLRYPALLVADSRSTFDSAAHIYGGETTNLALPAAIPADSLERLGSDLVLIRLTFKGIFSECFIPSTTDTAKHDKAPVVLCVRHKRLLAHNMERPSVISLRASDRRQKLDSDATMAVVERFDSNHLPEAITVAAVTRRVIGECHQQAHAFLVVLTLGEEANFSRETLLVVPISSKNSPRGSEGMSLTGWAILIRRLRR